MISNMISVIIPVYNTEKYLEACLESVKKQTYYLLEVIVVDDGSSDGSGDICEQFAKEDDRFRVIRQDNGGVSKARNRGLREAKGEYIFFLDSDDMLPLSALEAMKNADLDLVIGGFEEITEHGRENGVNQLFEDTVMKKEEFLWVLFDESKLGYQGYLWNKLYKKSIIEQYCIRFDENIQYNEDRLFIAEYMLHCRNVQLISAKIYYYRQHENSALGQAKENFKLAALTELDANEKMMRLVQAEYPEIYVFISRLTFEKALYWLKRIPIEYPEQKKRIRRMVRENARICLSAPNKDVMYKLKIILHTVFEQ